MCSGSWGSAAGEEQSARGKHAAAVRGTSGGLGSCRHQAAVAAAGRAAQPSGLQGGRLRLRTEKCQASERAQS